jgi:4-methoxybenzoate monooxygenase (O-demethylating)
MLELGFPVSDEDPYSTQHMTDPYPLHASLRELGPIVRLRQYDCWAVTRYEDVAAVLRDCETFGSGAGVGLANFRNEKPWRVPSIILEADPPLHSRTHKILARVMTPQVLRDFRPSFEAEARRLVDRLLERRDVDGMADIARASPEKVFPDAMGLPAQGRENLAPYGDMVFNAVGPRNALVEQSMALAGTVLPWIMHSCSRAGLTKDGLGAQVYAAADAGEATEEEAGMLVRSLLSAGLDTTIAAIGNALVAFSRFPEQWALLHETPSLARSAFDEAMRLESPVQAFFRTTSRATGLAGVPIAADEKVLVFFASANRDPRRWQNPDVFDIRRKSGGHVAFGLGIHRCVGEALAALEGDILLTELARRVRLISLAGEPVLHLNNSLRSFARIPLHLTAA